MGGRFAVRDMRQTVAVGVIKATTLKGVWQGDQGSREGWQEKVNLWRQSRNYYLWSNRKCFPGAELAVCCLVFPGNRAGVFECCLFPGAFVLRQEPNAIIYLNIRKIGENKLC